MKKKGQAVEADIAMSDASNTEVLMAFYIDYNTSQGKS